MGILIDKETKVLVQGITGREGRRATKEMLAYGTNVVCGVTPGKGGLEVKNVPVYDSIDAARIAGHSIDLSVIFVPPLMVFDAAAEALHHNIKKIVIVTENVPLKDTCRLIQLSTKFNAQIIGPSSVGIISVGESKVGSIAGSSNQDMFSKGPVGIISKSGGMCSETASLLTRAGIGQSTVIGIGGDPILGSSFADILQKFEKDPHTKCIVLYGEVGTDYEEEVAKKVASKILTKPIIAFIAGSFASRLDRNLAVGHAGVIMQYGKGSVANKRESLRKAGIHVVNYHHDIPQKVKEVLDGIQNQNKQSH